MTDAWRRETAERLLPIGTKVRYLRDHGFGRPDEHGRIHWAHTGAVGEVVGHIGGYPAARDVEESEACAVVRYESAYDDGTPGPGIERCAHPSDEGDGWEKV